MAKSLTVTRAERMTKEGLADKIERLLARTVQYLDQHYDEFLAEANYLNLLKGLEVLTDRYLLLRTGPTAGLDRPAQERMEHVLPLLLKEAHRRGLTVTATTVTAVSPPVSVPPLDDAD